MSKPFYITTTLPYVNSDPHIGFAMEIVQADIIARYQRLIGAEVFFTTGTDEHGQKIFQKAKESGQDVQAYVDHYAGEFKKLKDALNLSYDTFIRTTDSHHALAAQKLWQLCEATGDIYKKKYKGLYCVGDEAFIKEADLVNGRCPNHPNQDPIEIEEENYFFKLSNYQDKLEKYLSNPEVIVPDWRRDEAVAFVKKGLEDFSISREASRMNWGIPVVGDEGQVMYVWFDALTNYISTLGWPLDAAQGKPDLFTKFWVDGTTLQLAGKDQVRFQSIMWQAMLMSAGLATTDKVLYHGFITSGGQKMSKSLGNVINPLDVVAEYGIDAFRYIIARHIHGFDDADVTPERMAEWYNAGLVNGLGNIVARIMRLAQDNLDTPIALPESKELPIHYTEALERFDINAACEYIWKRIAELDTDINETAPFKVIKTDLAYGKELIAAQAAELYLIAELLVPILPTTSETIKSAILANTKPENLFPRK